MGMRAWHRLSFQSISRGEGEFEIPQRSRRTQFEINSEKLFLQPWVGSKYPWLACIALLPWPTGPGTPLARWPSLPALFSF